MQYEGVVDVFQTVRTLRTQRPAMVQTEDQYQFCYRAALEYLSSFDHYTDNWQSAGLELGVWRNFVILRIFGETPYTDDERSWIINLIVSGTLQARSRPFVSVTMEMPGVSDSDNSYSFWSNMYNQSPVKPRAQNGENGFHRNGFASVAQRPVGRTPSVWARRTLQCVRAMLTCSTCDTPAQARVYGRSDSSTHQSDSPPYLPSGPQRYSLNGHSQTVRTNGQQSFQPGAARLV